MLLNKKYEILLTNHFLVGSLSKIFDKCPMIILKSGTLAKDLIIYDDLIALFRIFNKKSIVYS